MPNTTAPKKARKLSPKAAAALIDTRVSNAYNAECGGIQVNITDISRIFAAGRAAIERGEDDTALAKTIRAFVDTIRQN